MDNFIYGLQNIAHYINYNIILLFRHQLVWGFLFGFIVSTTIHLFIFFENPRHLPKILTKSAASSFHAIAPKNEKGTYLIPYSKFKREYHRIQIMFYLTVLAFLLVVVVALLRY